MNELVEVYRSSVQIWECDQMGHMNVQFYLDKAAIGLEVFEHYLGGAPADTRRARLVPDEHHVRFLREQHAGAPLCMSAGVLDSDTHRLRIYFELRNPAADQVAATVTATVRLREVDTDEPLPLPAEYRERAAALTTELPAYAAPRGLEMHPPRPAPTLQDAEQLNLVRTYTGTVQPSMCDRYGRMASRWYMGIISDGIPNLLAVTRGAAAESTERSKVGGAALEYRFAYHRRPRSGDLLALRSGIKDIGPKAYTLGHWLFDIASGEAVATSEAVAVMFDLEARKAITIPDAARVGLERFRCPQLGV